MIRERLATLRCSFGFFKIFLFSFLKYFALFLVFLGFRDVLGDLGLVGLPLTLPFAFSNILLIYLFYFFSKKIKSFIFYITLFREKYYLTPSTNNDLLFSPLNYQKLLNGPSNYQTVTLNGPSNYHVSKC